MTVGFRQPGSDSSSESDYDEQLAKKVSHPPIFLGRKVALSRSAICPAIIPAARALVNRHRHFQASRCVCHAVEAAQQLSW